MKQLKFKNMDISLDLVKKLRDTTQVSIAECKKALEESGGDVDKAIECMRKAGISKAQSKSERATKEGIVALATNSDKTKGVLVKINCESDFVAKNADFVKFVQGIADQGLEKNPEEIFQAVREEQVLKIGENLTWGGSEVVESSYVSGYVHSNGKVASLVGFNQKVDEELAHDVAMQVVALNPSYLKPEDVPAEVIAKEKEIYLEQMASENKPDNVKEKIVEGKLNKFFGEVCLLKQSFIKDDSMTIEKLLASKAEIAKFVRMSV